MFSRLVFCNELIILSGNSIGRVKMGRSSVGGRME